MCDALKRASAAQSITAVIPYFGYARQDRKVAPRTPITAKLVADLLESAGATRVVSMDMHVAQIQGFFHIPSDHLFASPVFLEDIRRTSRHRRAGAGLAGRRRRGARARLLEAAQRARWPSSTSGAPGPNVSEVMNLIGDVRGKDAVLIDDMVDTAGTLTQAAQALRSEGARRVVAYAVHPILSGPAVKRIQESVLEEAVFTDTVPLGPGCRRLHEDPPAQHRAPLRRRDPAHLLGRLPELALRVAAVAPAPPLAHAPTGHPGRGQALARGGNLPPYSEAARSRGRSHGARTGCASRVRTDDRGLSSRREDACAQPIEDGADRRGRSGHPRGPRGDDRRRRPRGVDRDQRCRGTRRAGAGGSPGPGAPRF